MFISRLFRLPRFVPIFILHLETGLDTVSAFTLEALFEYLLRFARFQDSRLPRIVAREVISRVMCFVNKLSKMDLQEPSLDQHFVGHKGTVTSLSFSPSDRQLVSSSTDKSFMNWNLLSSSGSLQYKAQNLPVTHVTFSPNVQFSPDSEHILTASDDKNLKLWKTVKRKFVTSLSGHTNWVRFATYSPKGNLVVSCSDDKTIRIWDPRNSKQIHRFNEVRGVPRHVRFHPSGSCIGVAMSTDVAKIYDIRMMKLLQYYPCHEGPVNSLSFHSSGKYMLTGGKDKTCKIIDLLEGRPIFSLEAHTEAVTAVAFSHTGDHFATGSEDKNVFVWKLNLETKHSADQGLQESFSVSKLESPKSLKPNKPKVTINESPVTVVYSAKDYEESSSDYSEDDNNEVEIDRIPSRENSDAKEKRSNQHSSSKLPESVKSVINGSGDAAGKIDVGRTMGDQPLAELMGRLVSSIQSMNDEIKEISNAFLSPDMLISRFFYTVGTPEPTLLCFVDWVITYCVKSYVYLLPL
ncbi:hypothetical protein GE061_006283 [Apolygus lucorum]|uniref:WD repeat-containing protein 55 homolog n=1 Tax=Apolygus lucorum TaxID=248454 RepID=A0A8S9WXE4_APOLU|nr:hypothetical protein GE061_006283 [Apolygus lucorum]